MKRKYADKANWTRVSKKEFKLTYVEDSQFKGYLSMIKICKIKYPLIKVMNNQQYNIADDGYIWLNHIPVDKHYAITTMFNNNGEIVQWYFDVTKKVGVNDQGIPYFDDLYLDVVILPSNEILLLDEDELEEALRNKDITEDDYKLAYEEAEGIIKNISSDINNLRNFSNYYLEYILST